MDRLLGTGQTPGPSPETVSADKPREAASPEDRKAAKVIVFPSRRDG